MAVAPSPLVLAAGAAVCGVGGACAPSASGRAIATWFRPARRGRAFGLRQAAGPLGGALAAALLPVADGAVGLRGALFVLAGLLTLAAAGALAVPNAPPSAADPRPARPGAADRSRLRRLVAASALLSAAQFGLVSFLVTYLHEVHAWSVSRAAGVLLGLHIAAALIRVAVGASSDRSPCRAALLRRIALSAAAALGAAAALAGARSPATIPALVLAGLIASSWNGVAFAAAVDAAAPARRGTTLGAQNALVSAASAASPPFVAWLVTTASWAVAWTTLAALQLAAASVLRLRSPAARALSPTAPVPLLADARAHRHASS